MEKSYSDELILNYKLKGYKNVNIAKKLNIDRNTVTKIINTKEFKDKLSELHNEITKQTVMLMQSESISAIKTIAEIMKDTSISPQIRLNASNIIINNVMSIRQEEREYSNIVKSIEEIKQELEKRSE